MSASRLLLPLLLPRVYPPLFQLYALHNDKPDGLYWDRLQKWNRQTDSALMNFLGVDVHKFYVDADSGRHFSGNRRPTSFSSTLNSTDVFTMSSWFMAGIAEIKLHQLKST